MPPYAEYVDILGSRVSRIDLEQTMQMLEKFICDGGKHFVVLPAVHTILLARTDLDLRAIHNNCDLAPADGVPLLWAAKLFGKPIPGRVTGLDLLPSFCEAASRRGYTFFFLGGKEGVAELLKHKLLLEYPGLSVVGVFAPPLRTEFTEQENQAMIDAVNSVRPDVLWVGLTSPKQQKWVAKNIAKLDTKVAIAVGAAFDVCSGLVPRAPTWMQKHGLEWFHRYLHEPRRLFKRYFIDGIPFFPLVLAQRIGLMWDEARRTPINN